jgi:hypothetical protein
MTARSNLQAVSPHKDGGWGRGGLLGARLVTVLCQPLRLQRHSSAALAAAAGRLFGLGGGCTCCAVGEGDDGLAILQAGGREGGAAARCGVGRRIARHARGRCPSHLLGRLDHRQQEVFGSDARFAHQHAHLAGRASFEQGIKMILHPALGLTGPHHGDRWMSWQ